MNTKRIVITGGPGSGKTSLIQYLETQGHAVMHEVSREVILQAQKEGIEQLFLEDPILFSEKLLEGRLEQYKASEGCKEKTLFYDRGIPDIPAYMDYSKTEYPSKFVDSCLEFKYDLVFVLPPWKDIYHPDNERYESFEQAEEIFHYLKNTYEQYGYTIVHTPMGTLEERAKFILDTIKASS